MSAPPTSQLLLVRFLFQKGQDMLVEGGSLADGLSISLFQDAVELMARTIAKETHADVRDKDTFDSLWEKVKTAPNNTDQKDLPLRAKMADLNKARVGFKHYGNLPAESDARKFERYANQFLQISCREFFCTEFDQISLIDLIEDRQAAEFLRTAEQHYKSKDLGSSFEEVAKARYLFNKTLFGNLPEISHKFSHAIRSLEPVIRNHDITEGARIIEANLIFQREFMFSVTVGISMQDTIRLRAILPGVSRTLDDTFHIQWVNHGPGDEAKARFAIDTVIKLGLAVQKTVGSKGAFPITERDLFHYGLTR